MKRLLASGLVVAALALQGCGHGMTPAAPYQSSADQASQTTPMAAAPSITGVRGGSDGTSTALPGYADAVAFAEETWTTKNGKTLIVSGPLGDTPLACGTHGGTTTTTLAKVSSPWATTGKAVDSYTSSATTGSKAQGTVVSTSTIEGVSILKGLITAKSLTASAQSTASASSQTSTATGSKFDTLVIAGKPVTNPKPNMSRYLKGYGYYVLDQQQGTNNQKNPNGSMQTTMLTTMIRVVVNVSPNPLNVPLGTTIEIGNAYTSFTIPPAPYSVDPSAYSLLVTGFDNKSTNASGPYDGASVACNTNSDSSTQPGTQSPVGPLGTMKDDASSSATKSTTAADADSKTASASFLNGLIVAKNIKVSSSVQRNGTKFTHAGTMTVDSLSINGKAQPTSPAANTKIVIAGLGYVVVNEQTLIPSKGGYLEEVNGVHLYVTTGGNKWKMAAGGQLVLGHAHSQIDHT